MSARKARRATQQGAAANGHWHSNQPSREQLHRENERLLRENEDLRRKVAEGEKQIEDAERQIAEREKQIADAEKQIAELERQLAGRKKNSTNSSATVFGRTCWRAETVRSKAQKQAEAGSPAWAPGASPTIGCLHRGERH